MWSTYSVSTDSHSLDKQGWASGMILRAYPLMDQSQLAHFRTMFSTEGSLGLNIFMNYGDLSENWNWLIGSVLPTPAVSAHP